ncbi:amino acid permease [Crossiella sp. S99.2]|nr:amino acid permease [Crossiella sp. S99.2]MCK2258351.1 amino acid permease [Crossiella sp. S99.1]
MIAIGGAIGTGLFLGSGLAVSIAGPAVIIAYVLAALVTLTLAYALAEMVVRHPEAGGFGSISQRYLGHGAGFVQRWLYWASQVTNIGSEAVAAGLYLRFWYPELPLWLPVIGFSATMLLVNAASVRLFGRAEYWFAMIKVVTIVAFIAIGLTAIFFGLPGGQPTGLGALTEHGGFAPNGVGAIFLSLTVVTFSFLGTEAIAVTAAESRDPGRDIPRAARRTVLRLALFYVLAMLVVVTIVPWQQVAAGSTITESPFVRVFGLAGLPAAATVMNFVVLTAVLSAMNTNLYVTARMTYSLARDGYAPAALAVVSRNGAPRRALGLSAIGLALAALISVLSPDTAFPFLVGLALFSALGTWFLIFASHLAFRREHRDAPAPIRLAGAPYTTIGGMLFVAAVTVGTAFTEQFATVWQAGVPFVLGLTLVYLYLRRRRRIAGE